MRVLILAIVLMSFPWVSQAKGNHHRDHYSHSNHEYNDSYFWDSVDRRQHRQYERIERGIDKGLLTRREIRKLKKEQKHVSKQIRHFKRHRYLKAGHKREIMEHLDFVSNKIRDLKHNDRIVRRTYRKYSNHGGEVQNHNGYTRHDKNRRFINNHSFSWGNSQQTAGFYFRF